MLWDNGLDQLDRSTGKWRDVTAIDILMSAVTGTPNTLPSGTTDAQATTQSSSAYLYHRVGDQVVDQTLQLELNGNTLLSITGPDGNPLAAGVDYTASGPALTFKAPFLSKYHASSESPGIKASLTLNFSRGAALSVDIVQWDTPVLAGVSSSAISAAGSDLPIPVTYKGLNKVAAVKISESDGKFLVDDWTQYLGPLQQGRGVS
jgi:endoglucanase